MGFGETPSHLHLLLSSPPAPLDLPAPNSRTGGTSFFSSVPTTPFSPLQLDTRSTHTQETSPLCLLMLHLPSWHREHLFSWHWVPSN